MKLFREIKNRLLAIKWFFTMCHGKKIDFFSEDTDFSPDWKTSPLNFSERSSIDELLKNLDAESCQSIFNFLEKLSVNLNLRNYKFAMRWPCFTEQNRFEYFNYLKNENAEFRKMGIPEPIEESAAFFHHGMRFLPDSVKNYAKDKIFIDGGACFGDSCLAFMNYEPNKILAFDISRKNAEVFYSVMKKNDIQDDKVILILKGLSDKSERISFMDGKAEGTSANVAGNTAVEMIPLDACEEIDSPVGWIKIDLEGYGLPAVKGMVETIKRDRPVLTLAVYHCADELFGIKKLLESWDLNYKIMFRTLRFDEYHELTLIAYPVELDQN